MSVTFVTFKKGLLLALKNCFLGVEFRLPGEWKLLHAEHDCIEKNIRDLEELGY